MVNTIAELGINYAYGSDKSQFISNAKKLIDVAKVAGFKYVKLQKRNPDICIPEVEKNIDKIVPWRKEQTTYIQYKRDIEFSINECILLIDYANKCGLTLFFSTWDIPSLNDAVLLSKTYNKSPVIVKIPSALIINEELLIKARSKADILMISTGMSTEREIEEAVKISRPDVIFHTNSAYPSKIQDLNLNYIKHLAKKYPQCQIGYSGHEYGLTTTIASVVLGAKWIERHITLDRTNWGSDQLASVEPIGQIKLIKGIKELEIALGSDGDRILSRSELEKMKTLRGK